MSDLINRQDAIRWVKTECNPYGKPTLEFESGKKVIEHLEKMPSADRPTGEWTIEEAESIYGKKYILTCSECGKSISVTEQALPHEKFCRSCGARMNGGEEE